MINTIKAASIATASAWRRIWRIARRTYHVAAFASLVIVTYSGWQISHGKLVQFDGVAHASLPFGNPQQAMLAQLPADQVLPPQAMQPIPDKLAKVSYRQGDVPQRKPGQ